MEFRVWNQKTLVAINTNTAALRVQHSLKGNELASVQAAERLSSGKRINSSGDDPAGLAAATKLMRTTQGLKKGYENAATVIDGLRVIDEAYATIDDMLMRMHELSLQSANGIYSSVDRTIMDGERAQILQEMNALADKTIFNERKLLDGTFKDVYAVIGAFATELTTIDIEKIEGIKLGKYWELGFANNNFSDASSITNNGDGTISIPGWTIGLQQIALGPDDSGGAGILRTLGGFATPTDPTPYPVSPSGQVSRGDDYAPTSAGANAFQYSLDNEQLRLFSTGLIVNPGDVTHGPYVISDNAVTLSAGDSVTFNWRAANGGDAYDVYAYLLNTATGATIELLDETGDGTDWAPASISVNAAGDYKFVFISGTFDKTFGTVSGASLYIDDVDVESANGPEVVVQYINVLDQESARTAVDILDIALSQVSSYRAYVGSLINRLESAMSNVRARELYQSISIGRIQDADYAREVMALTKTKLISQAAESILVQSKKIMRQNLSQLLDT
jgi:flagellin-like hook-associated protein FlgL